MSKSKKLAPRKKVALGLLYHILGHISTRSLMDGDTENVWKDIEPKVYPDPLFKSCQISLMKKKSRSKNVLNPKAHFKWFLMDNIPETAPKCLTSDTFFSNYLLIVDSFSKIPNVMVWIDLPQKK